jgi:PPOX class probable F420-dependent enzyme
VSVAPEASRPDIPQYGIAPAGEGEGLLPWPWAEERLAAARTYWISTVRASGAPHVAPVWALWFDGAVVFSTSPSSRKAVNIARDPRVVVAVEAGDDAVIVEGVVAGVVDGARRDSYCDAYEAKYGYDMRAMTDPLHVVEPRVVFGFIASDDRFTTTATRWTF